MATEFLHQTPAEVVEDIGFCADSCLKLDAVLRPIVHYAREMLAMEVGFISEFSQGRRYFRVLDSDDAFCPLQLDGSDALDDSYCQRVVDGRLPHLINDARLNAEALTLPVTLALPVAGHISVPVRFRDGSLFGTFCCFSRRPATLTQRDLDAMYVFGDLIAQVLQSDRDVWLQRQRVRHRILAAIRKQAWRVFLQPMYAADDHRLLGYEALCRFDEEPDTERWFLDAEQAGLLAELELACLESALEVLPSIPADRFVSFNLSPQTLMTMDITRLPLSYARQIVIELTEHRLVDDYASLGSALDYLRAQGIRLAVDDAGAGFASFRHVLQLKPQLLKLDRSLISGIHNHPGQQALARALIGFSREMAILTVAEGVETVAEGECVAALGVDLIQGYWLACPQPVADWVVL